VRGKIDIDDFWEVLAAWKAKPPKAAKPFLNKKTKAKPRSEFSDSAEPKAIENSTISETAVIDTPPKES